MSPLPISASLSLLTHTLGSADHLWGTAYVCLKLFIWKVAVCLLVEKSLLLKIIGLLYYIACMYHVVKIWVLVVFGSRSVLGFAVWLWLNNASTCLHCTHHFGMPVVFTPLLIYLTPVYPQWAFKQECSRCNLPFRILKCRLSINHPQHRRSLDCSR